MKKSEPAAAIDLRKLTFAYEASPKPILRNISAEIPEGSRTLLIGANGVGKSTLLSLIAGRHILPEGVLEVFGHSPFHQLSTPEDVGLVDGDYPIHVDLTVRELLEHPSDRDPVIKKREKEILNLLDIDVNWRMCHVSEGQRRRVQILLSLRKPRKLLLLDEVSSHLDICVREDLMTWLKSENERHGLTILYTTHIFDGLWPNLAHAWPTHLALMSFTKPLDFRAVEEFDELQKPKLGSFSPLYQLCLDFIRADERARKRA